MIKTFCSILVPYTKMVDPVSLIVKTENSDSSYFYSHLTFYKLPDIIFLKINIIEKV